MENTLILTVLLRRLFVYRNQNSPKAQTVDFCTRFARKTTQICLSFSSGITETFAEIAKPLFMFKLPNK